ncbi:MAG TPA: hypothetical protein VLA75_02950 [Thermoanaerobaculia bacterium]|nr:hypothetical protein [Thermoanaerobaculia bacterium]
MRKTLLLTIVFGLLAAVPALSADGAALGIQGGIGEFAEVNQPYFAVGLRLPLGDREDEGVRGYWEPEVTYTDGDGGQALSLGVNLVGSLTQGVVGTYIGAGLAYHDLSYEPNPELGEGFDLDDSSLGANFHAGVDLRVSDGLTLFGQGRIDFIEGQRYDKVLGRATIGLRIHF